MFSWWWHRPSWQACNASGRAIAKADLSPLHISSRFAFIGRSPPGRAWSGLRDAAAAQSAAGEGRHSRRGARGLVRRRRGFSTEILLLPGRLWKSRRWAIPSGNALWRCLVAISYYFCAIRSRCRRRPRQLVPGASRSVRGSAIFPQLAPLRWPIHAEMRRMCRWGEWGRAGFRQRRAAIGPIDVPEPGDRGPGMPLLRGARALPEPIF